MTSISQTEAPAQVQAVPKAKARNASLDRARTFLTLVVLLHHAVIPYTHFGHTDPKSWIGFDMIVLATDSFFMAMFFFLSGLFVWPGIARKGPLNYLRDRLLRLGLPFVICAFTIIPLAYYAISLRQNPDVSFAEFWSKTITVGPWPSGPIWFLWVLFAFDLIACLLYRLSPRFLDPINRLSLRGHDRPAWPWSDGDGFPPEGGKAQIRSLAQRDRVVGDGNDRERADHEGQAKPDQPIAQGLQRSFPGEARPDKQPRQKKEHRHEKAVGRENDHVEADPRLGIGVAEIGIGNDGVMEEHHEREERACTIKRGVARSCLWRRESLRGRRPLEDRSHNAPRCLTASLVCTREPDSARADRGAAWGPAILNWGLTPPPRS